MRFANAGDIAIIGLGDITEESDFARVIGTHFYNSDIGFGFDREQGEWHSYIVVEVALSGYYIQLL